MEHMDDKDEEEQERQGQLSRPSSLLGPRAVREHLKFQIYLPTLVGAPPEVVDLVNQIQLVAEKFLYHWKTFPIGTCRRVEEFYIL